MKNLRLVLLTLILSFSQINQPRAAVAALVTIWNPVAATTIALYGLAAPVVGGVAWTLLWDWDGRTAAGIVLGGVLGLVILDEEGIPEFSQISYGEGIELGASEADIEIYNSEIEEANLILQEISVSIKKQDTTDDVQEAWTQYESLVSPSTLKVMRAITVLNIPKELD